MCQNRRRTSGLVRRPCRRPSWLAGRDAPSGTSRPRHPTTLKTADGSHGAAGAFGRLSIPGQWYGCDAPAAPCLGGVLRGRPTSSVSLRGATQLLERSAAAGGVEGIREPHRVLSPAPWRRAFSSLGLQRPPRSREIHCGTVEARPDAGKRHPRSRSGAADHTTATATVRGSRVQASPSAGRRPARRSGRQRRRRRGGRFRWPTRGGRKGALPA